MPCPYSLEDLATSSATTSSLLQRLEEHSPIHEITHMDLNQMLTEITTVDQVTDYLTSSPHFSPLKRGGTRWTCLSSVARHEIELYDSYAVLIKHILNHFGVYQPDKRHLFNAFDDHGEIHNEDRVLKRWTSRSIKLMPILSTIASNETHFHSTSEVEDFNFCMCVTPIEVRMSGGEVKQEDEEAYLAQCAFYADQIFTAQPGRRSVYTPLITESHIRLYQFDQGGVLRGPWINIHQNPGVFIRILLFTLSEPAVQLGAHPSFVYEASTLYISVDDVRYRVQTMIYELSAANGGPCCVWRAFDPQEEECVIKWCWSEQEDTAPEYEILNHIRGLEGVAQIIAHQEAYSMFKGRVFVPEKPFAGLDMLENIIVMKSYGESLEKFTSPLQFLGAYRDAMAGHRNLWNARILHRDISLRNILLGAQGASEGSRGVLIDMDRAVAIGPKTHLPKAHYDVGTTAFQSYNVISSQINDDTEVTTHDYLDDLESFLWVFIWITVAYKSVPNERAQRVMAHNPLISAINSDSSRKAIKIRRKILIGQKEVHLEDSYPPQFDVLKTQLIRFFRRNVLRHPKTTNPVTMEELSDAAENHYAMVLGFIDEAIANLKSEEVASDVIELSQVAGTISKNKQGATHDQTTAGEDSCVQPKKPSRHMHYPLPLTPTKANEPSSGLPIYTPSMTHIPAPLELTSLPEGYFSPVGVSQKAASLTESPIRSTSIGHLRNVLWPVGNTMEGASDSNKLRREATGIKRKRDDECDIQNENITNENGRKKIAVN